MVVAKVYSGASVQTTVVGSMTPSVPGVGQTFTLADPTNWPTGGDFVAINSVAFSNEEKILCNRSGATCTVVQRGYDGTTPQTHSAGSPVEHRLDSATVTSLVQHVDGLEANPHSGVLLNNAAHDVEARHTFGNALGTPVTPVALTPDIAGAAGTGNNPAREDHVHNLPAAAAVTSGLADAEGVAATFARSDHTHDQAALSIGSAELAANAVIAGKIGAGAIDNGALIVNAVISLTKVLPEAATTYVPTFTNVVIGGGGVYGSFWQIGRIVVGAAGFQLGDSGNVTGPISVNAPTGVADMTGGVLGGSNSGAIVAGRAFQSPSTRYSGLGIVLTGAPGSFSSFATAGAGVWDNLSPFNWGGSTLPSSHDVLQLFFFYMST